MYIHDMNRNFFIYISELKRGNRGLSFGKLHVYTYADSL